MFWLVYDRCKNIYFIQGAKVPLRPGEHVIYVSDHAWEELYPLGAWLQTLAERIDTLKRKQD